MNSFFSGLMILQTEVYEAHQTEFSSWCHPDVLYIGIQLYLNLLPSLQNSMPWFHALLWWGGEGSCCLHFQTEKTEGKSGTTAKWSPDFMCLSILSRTGNTFQLGDIGWYPVIDEVLVVQAFSSEDLCSNPSSAASSVWAWVSSSSE